MSGFLIAGVGIVYAVISFEQFRAGNAALGITFAGYSFSNVGLWWAAS
jgi:hypothetical protein